MPRTVADWHFTIQNCFINEKKIHILGHWSTLYESSQFTEFWNIQMFGARASPKWHISISRNVKYSWWHFQYFQTAFTSFHTSWDGFPSSGSTESSFPTALYVCSIGDFGVSEDRSFGWSFSCGWDIFGDAPLAVFFSAWSLKPFLTVFSCCV